MTCPEPPPSFPPRPQAMFDDAADYVAAAASGFSTDLKLTLYGLYKQASGGGVGLIFAYSFP